jgi:hypothetical protein
MALRSCKRLSCSPCTRRAAITLSLAVLIFGVSVWAQNTNGRVIGIVASVGTLDFSRFRRGCERSARGRPGRNAGQ